MTYQSELLAAMKADADLTRAAMEQHSAHGQMAAWASLGERLANALDEIDGSEVSAARGSEDGSEQPVRISGRADSTTRAVSDRLAFDEARHRQGELRDGSRIEDGEVYPTERAFDEENKP